MAKGLYRRASNLARVGAASDSDDAAICTCRLPKADIEDAKICRSVLSLMVSQMGRSLLTGGNVMNVSFPIQCCQPKTTMEIGSLTTGYMHHFLPRAAATKDPLERMKQVTRRPLCCSSVPPLEEWSNLRSGVGFRA